MPLYETQCKSCGDRRDVLVPRTTSDLPKCTCGGERDRLISATAMFVAGAGSYSPGASVRSSKPR